MTLWITCLREMTPQNLFILTVCRCILWRTIFFRIVMGIKFKVKTGWEVPRKRGISKPTENSFILPVEVYFFLQRLFFYLIPSNIVSFANKCSFFIPVETAMSVNWFWRRHLIFPPPRRKHSCKAQLYVWIIDNRHREIVQEQFEGKVVGWKPFSPSAVRHLRVGIQWLLFPWWLQLNTWEHPRSTDAVAKNSLWKNIV